MRRYSWGSMLSLGWLLGLIAIAGLAAYLPLSYMPAVPDLAQVALPPFSPGSNHWLGTDPLGRDVLAGLIFGTRTVVALTLPAAILAALLGAAAGGAAGFWGNQARLPVAHWLIALGLIWWGLSLPAAGTGMALAALGLGWRIAGFWRPAILYRWPIPLDTAMLGIMALLGSVPRLVLVVAVVAATRVSLSGLLVLLTCIAWPPHARLVRAETLKVRILPFVEAARAAGLTSGRLWFRHVLPHALQPLRVAFPLSLASLIALESTLSFLGIGLGPEVASWGRLMSSGRLDTAAWWTVCFPGLVLLLTMLALRNLAQDQRHSSSRRNNHVGNQAPSDNR